MFLKYISLQKFFAISVDDCAHTLYYITQNISSLELGYFIGVQAAFPILMVRDQNASKMKAALVPHNCQAVWDIMRPHIYTGDFETICPYSSYKT